MMRQISAVFGKKVKQLPHPHPHHMIIGSINIMAATLFTACSMVATRVLAMPNTSKKSNRNALA